MPSCRKSGQTRSTRKRPAASSTNMAVAKRPAGKALAKRPSGRDPEPEEPDEPEQPEQADNKKDISQESGSRLKFQGTYIWKGLFPRALPWQQTMGSENLWLS